MTGERAAKLICRELAKRSLSYNQLAASFIRTNSNSKGAPIL
jgi:hypothetical protein